MLDLPLLQRLELVRRPLSQRLLGRLLGANYRWLPGVALEFVDEEKIPDEPVIFAMNHTDRYNYFPFQYSLWKKLDRFTATWVKGKYYENPLMARFMESMLQLPTVSRGYLITRDFVSVLGRTPTAGEYALLRDAVDACAIGEPSPLPEPPEIPERLLGKVRSPLGVAFDPAETEYPEYICALFRAMMGCFVDLNRKAIDIGLDLLVFPQGTRSIRLLPSHTGIAQMALHLRVPIVPVGCNGSDHVFPGGSPVGRKGRIEYRIGDPIAYADLAPHHIAEDYLPFTAAAERDHAPAFRAVAELVTERIEPLLDERYRRAPAGDLQVERRAERFV